MILKDVLLFLVLSLFLFLFFQDGLLLFLQCFQPCGHSRHLFVRVCFIGLVVSFELGQKLLVIGGFAQEPHDKDASQTGKEIVIVQSGRVVVEHEEEGYRHDVHHVLHELHLLCLFTGHAVLLLAHANPRVDDIGQAEQQAENAEMVSDEPDGLVPSYHVIVCRKVGSPKETFPTQFDGIRNEVEQGNPDRHL